MDEKTAHKPRAIALIDGEHYFPVVSWALGLLTRDYNVVGAVFLGGTEKVGSESDLQALPVPVVHEKDFLGALHKALDVFDPEVAVDLSDEPVVGYYERFTIACHLLARGVRYVGKDFSFNPPSLHSISVPSISIVGTGKRTGKTALAAHAARLLRERWRVAIVTMGRGGPAEPEVLRGHDLHMDVADLVEYADRGFHAASGCFGHAYMTRVLVIGCRRCGGGMAGGEPFFSNVMEGARIAEHSGVDIVLFDGSGATAPPIQIDKQVLIVGAHQPLDYVRGFFGPYRILRSSAVVMTGCEPPLADQAKMDAMEAEIRAINPRIPVFRTVFRPRPERPVPGARVFLAVTAPSAILPRLIEHVEDQYRCRVVGASAHLSNRVKLRQDLSRAGEFDILLTELKAAAVDVAARAAISQGRQVVFVDNEPVAPDILDLNQCLLQLAEQAIQEKRGSRD